jgi:hypothetical protein
VKLSRIRYYSEDDFKVGLTRSQLKRTRRERQIEYMRFRFGQHFEDPAQETPYNSEEGGYLYIWGGPYNAAEQLGDEFGEFIPEDRIQEVVNYVERDGTVDWRQVRDIQITSARVMSGRRSTKGISRKIHSINSLVSSKAGPFRTLAARAKELAAKRLLRGSTSSTCRSPLSSRHTADWVTTIRPMAMAHPTARSKRHEKPPRICGASWSKMSPMRLPSCKLRRGSSSASAGF